MEPTIFSAPGRVNLIGEHTDYNDGFVMPSAIALRTRVTATPHPGCKLSIRSQQFPENFEADLNRLPQKATGAWYDYVLGVVRALQQRGHALRPASLSVESEVPIGAGLSSSAAIEVASALALIHFSNTSLSLVEIAKLCQHAENNFIGARVGIMDQFVSCLGKAGHALLLDCRSLDYELVPIPEGVRLVVCNTMVKHTHAGGEYNRRREECEQGVRMLARWYPAIRALRDLSIEQLLRHANDLPEIVFRRCRHVIEENQRVQDAAARLRGNDLAGFGELMRQSHCSLRDLYEVSCRELDIMVDLAGNLPGCFGARMTGGGFGGCTINLVRETDADAFAARIADRYRQATGIKPDIYICSAADGAKVESNVAR